MTESSSKSLQIKNHKKSKTRKKLQDLSENITLNYEHFEEEQNFNPHIFHENNIISIENVPLLSQNHFRFLIEENSYFNTHYNIYKKNDFANIKWEDIKFIYFYDIEKYSCPICLEQNLICPVITECGHIFCYPCLIRLYNYHTFQNNKIPKCPLCSKIIIIDKIKYCKIIQMKNYIIKTEIKFNLILRDKNSPTLFNLFYDPSLDLWKKNYKNKMKQIPFENEKEFNFSKISYINNKSNFLRLTNMKKRLISEIDTELNSSYSDESKINSLTQCLEIIEKIIIDNNINKKIENNISNKNNNNFTNIENEDINYKKYYLFYQEENGNDYYLDPFIIEILLTEYGGYENIPVEISGEILDIKMNQVTASFKKSYPYFNHLKIGSIIFLVEIDVTDLISTFTEKLYRDKLKEREKHRKLIISEEKNYEKFVRRKLKQEEEKNNEEYQNEKLIFIPNEEFLNSNNVNENNKDNNENENNNSVKKENKLKKLLCGKDDKKKRKRKIKKNKKVKEDYNMNKVFNWIWILIIMILITGEYQLNTTNISS